MNLANKSFRNNKTGEVVKVIDSFENIAILESKEKIDVRTLTDINHFTEQIDPLNFFNNQGAYNILADKIKNIPTNMLQEDPEEISNRFGGELTPAVNESAVIMTTEEDEKAELARKYGAAVDSSSQVMNQQQAFAKILGEDADDELPVITQRPPAVDETVMRVEVNRDPEPQEVYPNQPEPNRQEVTQSVQVQTEDPIITMFKNVKRIKEFSISLEIKNRIPRPDFIEMMEDSYNTSIIDFLASEFTQNILSNPQMIEDMIRQKIKEVVYGADTTTTVNSQITDAVTQSVKNETLSIEKESFPTKDLETPIKPKTTRKPRPNTTQGEKPGYDKPTRTRAKKETTK